MAQPHDRAYKLLFSHRQPVVDLLRGYVAPTWLDLLDLDTLEQAPTEHIGEALRRRENDIIWRVRWRHHDDADWLYIYLFLEFQSTVAAEMPVRLVEYIAMFYRDLIRAQAVPTDRNLTLPPVVPVVLYNGRQPWWAARDVGDLILAPEELRAFQVRMRYVVLDEAHADTRLAAEHNLVAMLFQLEQSRTPDDLAAVTQALADALVADEHGSLRQAVAALVRDSLFARLPGVRLPGTMPLDEGPHMIGDNIADWAAQQVAKGKAAGLAEGEAQGAAKGRVALVFEQLQTGDISSAVARRVLLRLRAEGTVPTDMADEALRRLDQN